MQLYLSYTGKNGPTKTLKIAVNEDDKVSVLLEKFVAAYNAKSKARGVV